MATTQPAPVTPAATAPAAAPPAPKGGSWTNYHLVAGITAGVMTTATLHPLDLVKTRFQVHDGRASTVPRYNSLAHAFRSIVADEGVRGLYRGSFPAMTGSGLSWGLYFYFYEHCKERLLRASGEERLSTRHHMYAAWESGSICVLITNPFWLVKTRMQLQTNALKRKGKVAPPAAVATSGATTATTTAASGAVQVKQPYTGLSGALRSIVKEEGVRGLYTGVIPALLLTSHGVVQFSVYEKLKSLTETQGERGKLSPLHYFAMGAVSKIAAATATYPMQVVKSRVQDRHTKYTGVWDCIRTTMRAEGPLGFFKGIVPATLRVVPASALTLVLYEKVRLLVAYLDPAE